MQAFVLTDEREARHQQLGKLDFGGGSDGSGARIHRAERDALDIAAVWRRALSI